MGVGMRIKIALREKKMTIKELSIQSGVSLNTLYSITKRDSENVDDVIIGMISRTLALSDFFFLGISPFEDLDFLQKNKEAILATLERDGLFVTSKRPFSDVSNYEFWQLLSVLVMDIYLDEAGKIKIDYGFTPDCEPNYKQKEKNISNNKTVDIFAPGESFCNRHITVKKPAPCGNGTAQVTFSIDPDGMQLNDLVDLLDYLKSNDLAGSGILELMDFVKAAFNSAKKDNK